MTQNVQAIKVSIEFNVAWALMNTINNKAYNLVKYYLEEMTLAYTIKQKKAVKMKFKDTNTPVTELAHKGKNSGKSVFIAINRAISR